MKTNSKLIIYKTEDGKIKIETHFENETVWLSQNQMALLFDKNKRTISEHIRNIFNEGELEEIQVVRNFRSTTQHGAIKGKTQTKDVKFYNLDVIISVGYRVRSKQGTQFRIWATQRLFVFFFRSFFYCKGIDFWSQKEYAQKLDERKCFCF